IGSLLLIIPDGTRNAPIGEIFRCIHTFAGTRSITLDVVVALGTHPPMSEREICDRLEIGMTERRAAFGDVQFFNHTWQEPAALTLLGQIPAEEIEALTEGRFRVSVDVTINRLALEYDHLLILGPVMPHEVVG